MVMDVVGSYGDWRQPRTPLQQTPPSLASTREHSPVAGADVNFNSPGHRSSQDGSFIQDEDMQLILEFGAKVAAASAGPNKVIRNGPNVGILSESWMHRHSKWATDFDANVAELDFDQFSRRDIRTLRQAAAAYHLGKNMEEEPDLAWESFTTPARDSIQPMILNQPLVSADCNRTPRTVPPCGSLDASLAVSAASLFSSAGGTGCNGGMTNSAMDKQELLLNNQPASAAAFISTDSLDMSSMTGQEELIRQACTTKKRDYVLTFDRTGGVLESGVGGSDDTDYQDACLSNAIERSLLNNPLGAAADEGESLTTENGDCDEDSAFLTWGRVRRSYEVDHQSQYEEHNARFTSLPNLRSSSRNSRASVECVCGGERMLSGQGDQCVPIYKLQQTSVAQDVSMAESINFADENASEGDAAGRFSLLKAFKSKLSGTFERLPLPQFRPSGNGDPSSGCSSGYMTGTGSQQGCAQGGAKPKTQPKAGDECEYPVPIPPSQEERNDANESPHSEATNDYRYAEFFVNGRYIDINHNEIGFVPPSTRGIQQPESIQQEFFISDGHHDAQGDDSPMSPPHLTSFQQAARARKACNSNPPAKPPRTFATLLRQQQEERDSECAAEYVIQQRPERAPYGRRILPKIPDENNLNGTEVSRMKDSATQVPVYVVDQSVQTAAPSSDHSALVVTTGVAKVTASEPCYVRSGSQPIAAGGAPSKLADWRKLFFGGPSSAFINVPDLNFLKFPFNVPQLFPHVPPFPMAFLNDGPDVTSFVAQQAKMINAGEDQLAAPNHVLPSPPSVFLSSKCYPLSSGASDQPRLAQTKMADCAGAGTSPNGGVRRDSGLGSSGGPSHIQDWDSLATLLPKDVLQAYSFFKDNSDLLGKSGHVLRPDLNIDKRASRRGNTSCKCSGASRLCGKRAMAKVTTALQRNKRLGKKQRLLSEPSFKRKQFESIVEEDKACDGGCRGSSRKPGCGCDHNGLHRGHHLHHFHVETWCCSSPSPGRCSECNWMPQGEPRRGTPCKRRTGGHVCVGDTDDTEEEGNGKHCEHKYRPLNNLAKKMGGESSDDERLVPRRPGDYGLYSEDDDDEEDDVSICGSPLRGTHSEYHFRDTVSSSSCVPKFHSVQNVKELSQFGRIGFPLKKLRPTQLTCSSHESAKPCATCYRVRSPSQDMTESGSLVVVMEEQNAASNEPVDFCDCKTSDILDELKTKHNGNTHVTCGRSEDATKKDLNTRQVETAAAIYQSKRVLVQNVVAACNMLMKNLSNCQRPDLWQGLSSDNAKAASAIIRYSLCPTVERLVADGLLQGKTAWSVVMASATLGPATKSIYELVADLAKSVGDNGEHSLLFVAFVTGLLRLRSLDCWLSYLSLKDTVLKANYDESSFFRKSATTYRTLFEEILIAIRPLSIFPFDQLQLDPLAVTFGPGELDVLRTIHSEDADSITADIGTGLSSTISLHKEIVITFQKPIDDDHLRAHSLPDNAEMEKNNGEDRIRYSLIPSRLPRDSRVPKSSSVPSKMVRHASEPPKSKSVDTGLKSGVVVNMAVFKPFADPKIEAARAGSMESDAKRSPSRPSRIPVLKSSLSCPGAPRQRSVSNRRLPDKVIPVVNVQSVESLSAMSVTASTFSEIDAPDCNFCSDSDYRSNDARYVYAIDEEKGNRNRGVLAFSKGDTMVLLEDKEKEDGYLHCQRGGEVGLVPRKKVTYVTFL